MAKFFKRLDEAVKAGDLDQLNRLLENKDPQFASQALSIAAQYGQLECVKFLVEKCSNHDIYHRGLVSAIHNNQSECINYLLSLFTQPFDCSSALEAATEADNIELVKRLIPLCNEKCGASALIAAMSKDNREIFNMLIPVPNHDEWGYVVLCAVEENRPEFFDRVLPLSDPRYDIYAAFRRAVELGHTYFAEVMYPLVDLQVIDEYLRAFEPETYEEFYKSLSQLEAKMQKDVLNDNLGEPAPKSQSVARKM